MRSPRRLRAGSRQSPLSLAQTEEVLTLLRFAAPETEFVVVPMSTSGDRSKDAPLLSLGRGTFAKDIETALLEGEIDIAVHSAKDLPPELPDGLRISAITERVDPRDVLVQKDGKKLAELPSGSRLGTSSPRRIAQLRAARPDLNPLPMRGNVGTRVQKAYGDDYDGAVLAAAGLLRLHMEAEIADYLSPETFTPEVGQGVLAIETRSDSKDVAALVELIDHQPSSTTFRAERAFLTTLGGGCKVPVTAHARLEGADIVIDAMAALPDGSRVYRASRAGDAHDPEAAGRLVAEALLDAGARSIVD